MEEDREVTAAQLATEFGLSGAPVARNWLRRFDIEPVGRNVATGAKLYSLALCREIRENMTGSGNRTNHPNRRFPQRSVARGTAP